MPKPYKKKEIPEDNEIWEYDHFGHYRKREERWEPLKELPYKYHQLVPPQCKWEHGDPCSDRCSYLTPGALNQILLTWGDDYVDAAARIFDEEHFPLKTFLIPSVHEFMLGYSDWYGEYDGAIDDDEIPRPHLIDETNHDSKFYMKHLRVMPWTGGAVDVSYVGCGDEKHPAILLMQSSFQVKGSGWKNSYGFTAWCDTLWTNAKNTLMACESDSDSLRISKSHIMHTLRVRPYDAYPELEVRHGKPHPKRRSVSYV